MTGTAKIAWSMGYPGWEGGLQHICPNVFQDITIQNDGLRGISPSWRNVSD